MEIGLLIVRVVVGALLVGHGSQKLFGWFGGYGLKGTGGYMESFGLRPARSSPSPPAPPSSRAASCSAPACSRRRGRDGRLHHARRRAHRSRGQGPVDLQRRRRARSHQRRRRHRLRLRRRRRTGRSTTRSAGTSPARGGAWPRPSSPRSAGAACSPCAGSASPPRARRPPLRTRSGRGGGRHRRGVRDLMGDSARRRRAPRRLGASPRSMRRSAPPGARRRRRGGGRARGPARGRARSRRPPAPPRSKRPKMRSRSSSAMPGPVSITLTLGAVAPPRA